MNPNLNSLLKIFNCYAICLITLDLLPAKLNKKAYSSIS